MLEAMRSQPTISGGVLQYGNALVVDPNTGGVSHAIEVANSSTPIPVPICKPMDGATITNITVWFYVPGLPTSMSGPLEISLIRHTPTLGISSYTVVGASDLQSGLWTPAQWYNNGQAQPINLGIVAVVFDTDILSGGGSYSAPPTVTFSAPGGGGVTATGVAVMSGSGSSQSVASITITNPGSGYTSTPTVAFSPTGATAIALMNPLEPLGWATPGSNTLDLSNYAYRIELLGPGTPSSAYLPNPIFTGVEIQYSYTDERFSQ